MRSITIHNLDPEVGRLIQNQAAEEGLSLNQLVKRLLRKALGLSGLTAALGSPRTPHGVRAHGSSDEVVDS
jgi:plasmid stability protein